MEDWKRLEDEIKRCMATNMREIRARWEVAEEKARRENHRGLILLVCVLLWAGMMVWIGYR